MSLLLLLGGASLVVAAPVGTGPGPVGVAATAVKPPRGSAQPIAPTAATAIAPRPSR